MKRRLPLLRRRRLRRAVLRAVRGGFRHIGKFSPSLSARLAEHMFRTPPPRYPRLKREDRWLALARHSSTPFPGGPLPTWTWGKGPAVLLVHGWGGHGGRLTPFVGPLTRAGFSVVAFDAPGHGGAAGRHSALPEFVDAIRAVAEAHGPFEAAIGHSMGGAACALALRGGLEVRSVVLLAPPADPEKYSGRFARFFCMPPTARDGMKREAGASLPHPVGAAAGLRRTRRLPRADARLPRSPRLESADQGRTGDRGELASRGARADPRPGAPPDPPRPRGHRPRRRRSSPARLRPAPPPRSPEKPAPVSAPRSLPERFLKTTGGGHGGPCRLHAFFQNLFGSKKQPGGPDERAARPSATTPLHPGNRLPFPSDPFFVAFAGGHLCTSLTKRPLFY